MGTEMNNETNSEVNYSSGKAFDCVGDTNEAEHIQQTTDEESANDINADEDEDHAYEGGGLEFESNQVEYQSAEDGDVSGGPDDSMSEFLSEQRSLTQVITSDRTTLNSVFSLNNDDRSRRSDSRAYLKENKNDFRDDEQMLFHNEESSEIENPSALFDKIDDSLIEDVDDNEDSNMDGYEDLEQELEYLRTRNKALEDQNRLLTQFVSLDNFLPDDLNSPIALVVIPDNSQARYYKDVIEEFLSNLPPITESKLRREKKTDEYKPMYQHSSFNLYSLLKQTDSRVAASKVKMIYNAFLASGEYIVDSFGQPLVNFETALTDGWVIPSFGQAWNMTIGDPDKPSETNKFQMSCFNCGGPHNLRECSEKRDLVRISQNRQALLERFGAAPGLAAKSTRYHLEVSEVDKRFTKFTAGRISQELREALGLHRRALPLFVYRMRQLGYPPGWLMEAEVQSSGLDIIHDKEQLVEDGEVVCVEDQQDSQKQSKAAEGEKQKEVTYNMDKLISYPGFNSKIPDGIKDECNRMRPPMPPMQKHQQLVAWNRFLAKDAPNRHENEGEAELNCSNSSYKRGYGERQDNEDDGELDGSYSKRARLDGTDDMDICEDEPVMPIIQPDKEVAAPFRGFVPPPPPDSPPCEEIHLRDAMSAPVLMSNWWIEALEYFVLDEETPPNCKKSCKRKRKQNTNIVLDEKGEIVESGGVDANDGSVESLEEGEVPIRFSSTVGGGAFDDDDDDDVTCGATSTVEDTVRLLRHSSAADTSTAAAESSTEVKKGEASDERERNGEYEDSAKLDEQEDHKRATNMSIGDVGNERKAFKITSHALEAIWQYHECVAPTETQLFLFPDKNDREVLEELALNPPPESHHIQLGDESTRYKSAKGLPEYWKFGQGIEPYEAKEEVPILGLYSRILNTLKQHNKSFR